MSALLAQEDGQLATPAQFEGMLALAALKAKQWAKPAHFRGRAFSA